MTAPGEIRLDIKARNNRLVKLREDLGMNQAQMAEALKLSPSDLGRLENFKVSPIGPRGDWSWRAKRIASFHCVSPEYIWPEAVRDLRAKAATVVLGAGQVLEWDRWNNGRPKMLECDRDGLLKAVGTLPQRQRDIIIERFGLGGEDPKTCEEIAQKQHCGKANINAIENKALRALRQRAEKGLIEDARMEDSDA